MAGKLSGLACFGGEQNLKKSCLVGRSNIRSRDRLLARINVIQIERWFLIESSKINSIYVI